MSFNYKFKPENNMKFKIYLTLFTFILGCQSNDTKYLKDNCEEVIQYFYETAYNKRDYNALSQSIFPEVGTYEFVSNKYKFPNYEVEIIPMVMTKRMKSLYENYGKYKKAKIQNIKSFYAWDYGIHNISITLEVEFERCYAIDILTIGFKKNNKKIKIAMYESKITNFK